MELWRYWLEVFVLVLLAFSIGAAVTAAIIRVRVKDKVPAKPDVGSATAPDPWGGVR